MAAAAVAVASPASHSSSASPTRDLLVPDLHLGSLQQLDIADFAHRRPSSPYMSPPPVDTPYTPPALVESPLAVAADPLSPQQTPGSGSGSSLQAKYSSLPPGAAPPAPGGTSGMYGSSPTPSSSQPQPHSRRPSGLDQGTTALPTPPPSHQQGLSTSSGGPRHPGAAQAAAQSALPGAPRPRAAYVPSPTYPSIVTPLSLQGLIASESPQGQQATTPGTPPTNTQAQAVPLAARKKPDEEVCIECMMRDRDMADVDVTSPGAWARPSDADWEDLLRREREEEMGERGTASGEASSSGHSGRPPLKVRSKGGKLTEENVRKWVLMNPKDHEARWRTITRYVKSQSVLLEQEFAARAKNEAESRSIDARARDRYAQLRRSTHGEPFVEPATGLHGVRVPSGTPTSASNPQPNQQQGYFGHQPDASPVPDAIETQSIPASPGRLLARAASQQQDRDVVLLENGLMLERVDLRRERSGRARSVSLDKRSAQNVAGADDRLSVYSTPVPRYPSPPVPNDSRVSGRAIPRAQSQMSTDRRSLFSGFRSSFAGSMTSLAQSRASVLNLHGQNFDHEPMPGRAISPSMPTLNDLQHAEWPGLENLPQPLPAVPASVGSEAGGKKKKRGALGKLLKFFGNSHSSGKSPRPSSDSTARPPHQPAVQEDLSAPLAPPPPLTYLMSRKSGELNGGGHQRQQSSASPPTAPSSILPSPTSNRFSWRASSASLDLMQQQQYVEFPAHLANNVKQLEVLPEGNGHGPLVNFDENRRPVPRARMDTSPALGARPHTVFLTDKSLPPLPPEAFGGEHPPRPGTAPGFRERERRASFAGHGRTTTDFGEEEQGGGKRRSKFGLSTLLGGKRKSSHQLRSAVVQDEQFVAYRYPSGDDLR
ncbi:hypothetical protein AURDEDRAFT_114953 [Auricularia subglabra TFB-10046 SS5]|nr:hypothetical protein AURDEDRAFT_114953 [Auricularia subglabra TFB-10046 SS5]